jgi:hypothetical protein
MLNNDPASSKPLYITLDMNKQQFAQHPYHNQCNKSEIIACSTSTMAIQIHLAADTSASQPAASCDPPAGNQACSTNTGRSFEP